MGKGSAGSGSASGSAGYSGMGAGYSAMGASPSAGSMYTAPITGIEAKLTITPVTADGAGYQPLSQQLYQPFAGSQEGPYIPGLSKEPYLAGSSHEPYHACPQCGSDVHQGYGDNAAPPGMSTLARVMHQAMQEAVKDFYRKACPACMTGKGMHTCGR